MNSKLWLSSLSLALGSFSCNRVDEPKTDKTAAKLPPAEVIASSPEPAPTVQRFGNALSLEEPTALKSVFAKPETYQAQTVLVEGYVQRACRKKGCWMEIAVDASENAQRCRVKFKDYGFFVPRDSAGSQAKVQGIVQVNTVSKERVDHLEAEGASFAHKRADGSALEVQLVATGVELKKKS